MHERLPGPEGGVENRGVVRGGGGGEVFNISRGTWQTLMYWKTMFDRCYCIISPKCSVTLAKNVALYFVNV